MKILIAAWFALLTMMAPCQSQAASAPDDMKEPLHALAVSQNLEKYLPAIARNAAIDGAAKVERGALQALDTTPGLSPAQQEKFRQVIHDLSGQMAAEIDEQHRKLDVTHLVDDMVITVYPKYYNLAEIRQLTAFYGSKTFHKMVDAELKITAQSKRFGANVPEIRRQAYAAFTEEDMRVVTAFRASDAGRKEQRIGKQLAAECLDYLSARTRPALDEVTTRYGLIAAKLLRDME